jgi:hypothetical protein
LKYEGWKIRKAMGEEAKIVRSLPQFVLNCSHNCCAYFGVGSIASQREIRKGKVWGHLVPENDAAGLSPRTVEGQFGCALKVTRISREIVETVNLRAVSGQHLAEAGC